MEKYKTLARTISELTLFQTHTEDLQILITQKSLTKTKGMIYKPHCNKITNI